MRGPVRRGVAPLRPPPTLGYLSTIYLPLRELSCLCGGRLAFKGAPFSASLRHELRGPVRRGVAPLRPPPMLGYLSTIYLPLRGAFLPLWRPPHLQGASVLP